MKYQVPCHLDIDGQKTNRMSIVVEDDLKAMYRSEITLWCDGRGEEGKKRKKDDQARSQEKEEEVEDII